MSATLTYGDVVEQGYERIYMVNNIPHLDDADKLTILAQLDKIEPQRNVNNSRLRIYFDCDTGEYLGTSSARWNRQYIEKKWIPNPGTDPDTPRWHQNDQNGYYLTNKEVQNFEFNDILAFENVTTGGSGRTARVNFTSFKCKSTVSITARDIGTVFTQIVNGYLIGRFCWKREDLKPLYIPE